MEPPFAAECDVIGARFIGEGGSGVVYAGEHRRHGLVAVKVARDTSGEIRQLLVSEYRLLRSLDHRAILPALDFINLSDGRVALLTPYCADGNLYSHVQQLSLSQRFRPLGRILGALEYLHSLGLLHRDLKGDNILIHHERGPLLADLGLAATRLEPTTERGGTLEYMAPEVIDNQGATVESDIYSLGVILYQLACGRLPFAATDPLQIVSQKRQIEQLNLDTVATAISPRLARLIRACLDPQPDQRPKTIRELAESLALDQLIDRHDFDTRTLKGCWHHHLYNFNASFWMQEWNRLNGNTAVVHCGQDDAVELNRALVDHQRISGLNLEEDFAADRRLRTAIGDTTISWPATAADAQSAAQIEYPELDGFAFDTLLGKLFPRQVDRATRDWLWELSAGNLALLWELLSNLEAAGIVDSRSSRLFVNTVTRFRFDAPAGYLAIVKRLTPTVSSEALELCGLVAAEPGMHRLDWLVDLGVASPAADTELRDCGLIDHKTSTFRRSYYRQRFYSAMNPDERRQRHELWLRIVADIDDLDSSQRARMVFHHAGRIGKLKAAFEAAIELARGGMQSQDLTAAEDVLDQALSLPGGDTEPALLVALISLRADVFKARGDLESALRGYAQVVRRGARLADQNISAQAYKKLGDVYKSKRDYRRGSRALDRAVKIFGRSGDEIELSHCFNNIGNICWIAGDLEGAEVNYETALEVQRNLGIEKAIASTLNNLASTNWRRQKYDTAIAQFKESLEIKTRLNDLPEMARTFNNLCVAYFEQDDLRMAQDYLKQALEINRQLGNREEELCNYENFFEIEYRRGNLAEARRWALVGLRHADTEDRSNRGEFVVALAWIFLAQGRYQKAHAMLRLAENFAVQVTHASLAASILAGQGELFRQIGDHGRALHNFDSAIAKVTALGDNKRQCAWMIRRCALLRATAQSSATIDAEYTAISELLKGLPAKRERLELLLERAENALDGSDSAAAGRFLAAAIDLPEFDGIAGVRPRLSWLRGRLELMRQNDRKAIQLLSEAVLATQTLGTPEIQWLALMSVGDAYRSIRDYEKSLKSYMEAFEIVKLLALQISDRKLRKIYLSDFRKQELAERLEEMSTLVA